MLRELQDEDGGWRVGQEGEEGPGGARARIRRTHRGARRRQGPGTVEARRGQERPDGTTF